MHHQIGDCEIYILTNRTNAQIVKRQNIKVSICRNTKKEADSILNRQIICDIIKNVLIEWARNKGRLLIRK